MMAKFTVIATNGNMATAGSVKAIGDWTVGDENFSKWWLPTVTCSPMAESKPRAHSMSIQTNSR
jgi:hypothetical protein